MPTRPPYCNLGTGRTRPLTSVICVSTLMSKVRRYGSLLKSAFDTWWNRWMPGEIKPPNQSWVHQWWVSISKQKVIEHGIKYMNLTYPVQQNYNTNLSPNAWKAIKGTIKLLVRNLKQRKFVYFNKNMFFKLIYLWWTDSNY